MPTVQELLPFLLALAIITGTYYALTTKSKKNKTKKKG